MLLCPQIPTPRWTLKPIPKRTAIPLLIRLSPVVSGPNPELVPSATDRAPSSSPSAPSVPDLSSFGLMEERHLNRSHVVLFTAP
mmetsp:Transcript_39283/g.91657  ORF Transcript_39283/g.91657 Transcript_39283/m.91657 type:complete len:84 (+) Transcript_39283:75-326(+)